MNRYCWVPKSPRSKHLPEGIKVTFDAAGKVSDSVYDRVLVAVGRSPNGRLINAAAAGVTVNERGFIPVDRQMRTNVPHIFAIGDIVGQPMLAHKAMHEAKVAAEVAAGHKASFDARVIPSVAYTDPEVAWVGITEGQAKRDGLNIRKASFPWLASGRSLSLGRDEGSTKLIVDAATGRVIGGGIVGPNAGELNRGNRAGDRVGCGCSRYRTDHPPASHPVRDGGPQCRGARRHFDGSVPAQESLNASGRSPGFDGAGRRHCFDTG